MAMAYGTEPGTRATHSHRFPRPLRAPFEAATWREFGFVLLSLPLSIVFFSLAVTLATAGAGLVVTFLGIPVLAASLAMCRGFGVLERLRARTLLGLDIAEPAPVRPRSGGPMAWMGAMLKSGVSWRHLLYALVHMPWAVFSFALALPLWVTAWTCATYPLWYWTFPVFVGRDGAQVFTDETHAYYVDSPIELAATSALGLLLLFATPWIVRGLTTVDRLLITGLLGPSRLEGRVVELESDRGVVVDTAAADLRRIERDLHDGAQARLVA
ncbi:sensor domain-containing protein, partial [Streptomyces sp. NPDC059828]|uniref:sensor domain-containing protein n=1 Tax=Streptomyces sp. NPDC059828 TaxID=3346965 RepID=UPI00366666FF